MLLFVHIFESKKHLQKFGSVKNFRITIFSSPFLGSRVHRYYLKFIMADDGKEKPAKKKKSGKKGPRPNKVGRKRCLCAAIIRRTTYFYASQIVDVIYCYLATLHFTLLQWKTARLTVRRERTKKV